MSDNDKLVDLSEKDKKAQTKELTVQARLLNEIEHELETAHSRYFDMHLFLLLFTIFKEGQGDIRIKNYVALLPTEQFDTFKWTVFHFNKFLYDFIGRNLNMPKGAESYVATDKLCQLIDEYNKSLGETIFRFPDLEAARPSLFDKIKGVLKK